MSVTMQEMDFGDSYFGLGDLGNADTDYLAKNLEALKSRDAQYLMQVVTLLSATGVTSTLATDGDDAVKALVGRTNQRQVQLAPYVGKTAPEWLYKQVRQDVLDIAQAAINAGVDIGRYVTETSAVAATARVASTAVTSATTVAPVVVRTAGASAAPVAAPRAAPAGSSREGFLAAYWLPLTIIGVGGLAAVALALLDRPRAAVAGLAGYRRMTPRRRQSSIDKRVKKWLASNDLEQYSYGDAVYYASATLGIPEEKVRRAMARTGEVVRRHHNRRSHRHGR
jgi:hypothetical protein